MSVIKCDITVNNKVIEVVTEETNVEPAELIISLENFRQAVNATFTKMIEDNGEIEDYINDEASDDDSLNVPVTPKKRKR